jgi:hypothetical protein
MNIIVFMNSIEIVFKLPQSISSGFNWLYQIQFQYYVLGHIQILKAYNDI